MPDVLGLVPSIGLGCRSLEGLYKTSMPGAVHLSSCGGSGPALRDARGH